MNDVSFHAPDAAEHERMLESERKTLIEYTIISVLFVAVMLIVQLIVGGKILVAMHNGEIPTAQERYLSEFYETKEHIIQELYGDRTAYADGKVWHQKVNFLDKEKSAATGTIVYDEEAYQAYYDQFLAEYDANIDQAKVDAVYEERKAEFLEYKRAEEKQNRKDNKTGLKIFGIVVMALATIALMAGIVIAENAKYQAVVKKQYMVTMGRVIWKGNNTWNHHFIKRRARIRHAQGEVRLLLSRRQVFSISEGDSVYLAKIRVRFLGERDKYIVCK